jgi:hypothetical protein
VSDASNQCSMRTGGNCLTADIPTHQSVQTDTVRPGGRAGRCKLPLPLRGDQVVTASVQPNTGVLPTIHLRLNIRSGRHLTCAQRASEAGVLELVLPLRMRSCADRQCSKYRESIKV